ncbi:MAG: hypothetical protein ACLSHC_03035 [Bilophila wadsworthia]
MADVLWRDTALTPKIFILDARAVFPWPCGSFIGPGGRRGWRCRHCRALSGAAHRHDAIACFRAIRVACMGRRRETRNTETLWRKRCRW